MCPFGHLSVTRLYRYFRQGIVPGPSVLPSRTVVLVDRNGGEDLTLTALSWYPIRSREPRRVARFIQTANTFIKP
jgi:hypothetical protein